MAFLNSQSKGGLISMYRCSDCDELFEEPRKITEHWEGMNIPDGGYDLVSKLCPYCGGSDYEEVIVCEICHEDVVLDLKRLYVKFKNGDIICNDCLHDYCVDNFT